MKSRTPNMHDIFATLIGDEDARVEACNEILLQAATLPRPLFDAIAAAISVERLGPMSTATDQYNDLSQALRIHAIQADKVSPLEPILSGAPNLEEHLRATIDPERLWQDLEEHFLDFPQVDSAVTFGTKEDLQIAAVRFAVAAFAAGYDQGVDAGIRFERAEDFFAGQVGHRLAHEYSRALSRVARGGDVARPVATGDQPEVEPDLGLDAELPMQPTPMTDEQAADFYKQEAHARGKLSYEELLEREEGRIAAHEDLLRPGKGAASGE